MTSYSQEEILELLSKDLRITESLSFQSEGETLRWLADEIAILLDSDMQHLLQILYRLDVDEDSVYKAMHPKSQIPVNESLAKLIYDRECQRLLTKKTFGGTGRWWDKHE